MWESRALCEIAKRLWKSISDFHKRVISIAFRNWFTSFPIGGCRTLDGPTIAAPGAVYTVESAPVPSSIAGFDFTSPAFSFSRRR
jgi:hypothetical protein